MQEIAEHYKNDKDVAVVTIQTAFEGFSINSKEALLDVARKYSLTIPIGHNGGPGSPSPLLSAYHARGTPWVVIIDKKGIIRLNNFFFKPEKSIELIDFVKNE